MKDVNKATLYNYLMGTEVEPYDKENLKSGKYVLNFNDIVNIFEILDKDLKPLTTEPFNFLEETKKELAKTRAASRSQWAADQGKEFIDASEIELGVDVPTLKGQVAYERALYNEVAERKKNGYIKDGVKMRWSFGRWVVDELGG